MKGNEDYIAEMLRKNYGFIIPVYQREYEWKEEQCGQLYNDLVSVVKNSRGSHFFGSIVDAADPNGNKNHFVIIDGQQRLTTISILYLAIRNILKKGILKSQYPKLIETIDNYLRYQKRDGRINNKLKPAANSINAYNALFNDDSDYIEESQITKNYRYFVNRIQEKEITIDELFDAIEKLIIIDIYLDNNDDAQLIFESLNSTGLELSESDKVRNYMLMSLKLNEQERYYNTYWCRIEENTKTAAVKKNRSDISVKTDEFIKNFLTIIRKPKRIPIQNKIYDDFKSYAREKDKEELLKEMLKYSKYYHQIHYPKEYSPARKTDEKDIKKIIRGLTLLRELDFAVINPYLLELLESYDSMKVTAYDVKKSLEIIEDYLFRRTICRVPTNSLDKVFMTLHNDVLNQEGNDAGYSEKLKYVLRNKQGNSGFPSDEKLSEYLCSREIYKDMNDVYKWYLLERLEQYGTDEKIDIRGLRQENKISIEHVMPQTLNDKWKEDLGGPEDAAKIHKEWLHKLANLTLTSYNSKYSNSSFEEKRDIDNGFKDSKFTLNKYIAACNKWTEEELIKRNELLTKLALKIWPPITSEFIPDEKPQGIIIPLNEDTNFTNTSIESFIFEGVDYQVKTWKDFLIEMLKLLHEKDNTLLTEFIKHDSFLTKSFSDNPKYFNFRCEQVIDGVYVQTNSKTFEKVKIICQCMSKLGIPSTDVGIRLSSNESSNTDEKHDD